MLLGHDLRPTSSISAIHLNGLATLDIEQHDGSLLTGNFCRVYHAPFGPDAGWINLSRRCDDDAVMPYLLRPAVGNRSWSRYQSCYSLAIKIWTARMSEFPERSRRPQTPEPPFWQAGLVVLR